MSRMYSDRFHVSSIRYLPRSQGERQIRERCIAQYFGNYEIMCRCLGQFKMFVDSRDIGFAPHIIMDGFWEYWVTQFIAAQLKEGATVLDIGANFGYYTLLMSELVGPFGKCIAFEPNPGVAAKLRKTISINGFDARISLHEVALGNVASGEISFFIPDHEPKNGFVVQNGGFCSDPGGRVITVRETTVDDICAGLERLDFIKIDAEGSEANIVDGMMGVIARLKPSILIEFNAGRAYDARTLVSRLYEMYGSLSFLDFDGQLKPVTIDRLETENVGEDWMLYFSR